MNTPSAASPARVLVADDDARLRHLFATTLGNAGFRVEQAADGDQALSAVEHACPDLLLADLVMPGLTGDELARRVRERCSRTVLVFMSGYSEEQLHALDIKQVVFLPKPISPSDLVAVVSRLVEESDGSRVAG
ncbi:MAG TPA: response regulator [Longimicrobiales bacterium]|nr:response regulator [Longimicrobiales bacterium]